MILPVYLYGTPVLREETEDIDKDYPGLGRRGLRRCNIPTA